MAHVKIFSSDFCPYCMRAKALLRERGVTDYEEIVVDGKPDSDVRVLQDRSRLRHVISRGNPVNLDRPWPTKNRLPGEKVGNWADEILTWERAALP